VGTAESASTLSPGPTNGLPRSIIKGERMVVDGLVVNATCAPLSGAQLNIWHTDPNGDYGPRGTEQCCYYQGTVLTDPYGRFRLDTIRPAQYPQPNAPPAHVHLEIRHGFGSLTTEITFLEGSGPPVASSSNVIPINLGRVRDTYSGQVVFVLPG
jgi:protocatechuate 3,4-dioxygenase beta subunit